MELLADLMPAVPPARATRRHIHVDGHREREKLAADVCDVLERKRGRMKIVGVKKDARLRGQLHNLGAPEANTP